MRWVVHQAGALRLSVERTLRRTACLRCPFSVCKHYRDHDHRHKDKDLETTKDWETTKPLTASHLSSRT